jgi:serine/threonine protein kinase
MASDSGIDSGDARQRDLHERAGEIFFDASQLPAADRAAFLDNACDGDRELQHEVESLLSAFEPGGGVFEGSAIDLFPDALPSAEPQIIDGKYRLEERLGGGGMGTVYRARHLGLERAFALKLLHTSHDHADFARLFEGEAKALGALRHRGVVPVTDYGVDPQGLPFLVMELLEGETLDAALKRRQFTPEESLVCLREVAEAIDYVHAQGIVHGDIKPSNMLLAPHPVLVDFGLAAIGTGAGTPRFIAPEVAAGARPTARSDVYSFGVMASLMLPARLGPLRSAMAQDPADRPSSAVAYVESLCRAWLDEQRAQWRKQQTPRRILLAAAIALLFAALAWLARPTALAVYCENRLRDAVLTLHPVTAPDPRLLLISFDDASLAADSRPLASLGDEFGQRLEQVFRAGARAIAIDILVPGSWSESRPFASLLVGHADQLTLALLSKAEGETRGPSASALW